jgi:hypothetical protein
LHNPDDELDSEYASDEVRPEDGRLPYWMFINGDQARLFSGLAAAFFALLWCFAYFLGFGSSVVGTVLLAALAVSFVAFWGLGDQLNRYQRAGWKSLRSPRVEKVEARIAIGLWLFIVLSICAIFLWRWLHVR